EERAVFSAVDADDIYRIPMLLHAQHLDDIICAKLGIQAKPADLSEWQRVVDARRNPQASVEVAFVGKYVDLADAYMSINEALKHAGIHTRTKVNIRYIDSEDMADGDVSALAGMDAILVGPGFGERG